MPAWNGMPVIAPLVLRVKGRGSVPARTVNVYGAVPPVALSAWLYAAPSVPAGSGQAVAIAGADGAAFTVNEQAFVFVCGFGAVASFTRTLNVAVPATVGVPETTPAAGSVIPAGKLPLDKEYARGASPPVLEKGCV